jgi:hypothetical protein
MTPLKGEFTEPFVETVTEVEAEVTEMRGQLAELEQLASDLWSRLASVVRPAMSPPVPEKLTEALVPLAETLRDYNNRITAVNTSLRNLKNSIQV